MCCDIFAPQIKKYLLKNEDKKIGGEGYYFWKKKTCYETKLGIQVDDNWQETLALNLTILYHLPVFISLMQLVIQTSLSKMLKQSTYLIVCLCILGRYFREIFFGFKGWSPFIKEFLPYSSFVILIWILPLIDVSW